MTAPSSPLSAGNETAKKLSPAEEIVQLVTRRGAELFHSPEGEPYLSIPVGVHSETRAIGTKRQDFRDWLGHLYYQHKEKVASETAIREAASILAGKAKHAGAEHQVHVRIAGHDGCIYVDLANSSWQAIKISRDGWQIVDTAPVKFVSPPGMLPLPAPVHGGRIDQLRQFLNVGGDEQWVLLVAWMLAALGQWALIRFWFFRAVRGARRAP